MLIRRARVAVSSALIGLLLTLLAGVPAGAAELPAPAGPVLLTIDGAIGKTTNGSAALLDRETLESLGKDKLSTVNPFLQGMHEFEGVPFSRVLDYVGADGRMIAAMALDGYVVDIPVEDLRKFPVILALRRNGANMGVRDKGPIWVVYPLSQYPDLAAPVYSGRMIWQLERITLK